MNESLEEISNISVARRYARSSIIRVVLLGINQVAALIYFALVISALPYVDVAIIGKASIMLTIASLLSPGGIFYYATTEVPKLISEGKTVESYLVSKLILKKGIIVGITIESIISLAFYITYSLPINYFIIIYSSITLLTIYSFLNILNLSWLNLKNYAIFGLSRITLSYIIIIGLFFFVKSVIVVFIGWLLSVILMMQPLIHSHPLRKLKSYNLSSNAIESSFKVPTITYIIKFGLPIYINYVLLLIGVWFDRIFSSLFLVAELFAIYFVMSRISDIVGNMLLSFKNGILSVLSFYLGRGVEKAKKASSIIINTFIFAFAGLIVVLAKFSYLIVDIMLGYKYISGAPILSILFIAIFFRSLYRILLSIVASFGEIKKIPLVTASTLLTRFFLYVTLIYLAIVSSINIAFATLFSEIFGLLLTFIFFKHILGFSKLSVIKIATISVLIVVLPIPTGTTILEGIVYSGLLIAIYLVLGLAIRALRDIDVYYLLKIDMAILNKILRVFLKLGRYKTEEKLEERE